MRTTASPWRSPVRAGWTRPLRTSARSSASIPDSAIGYYNLAYALADLDRDVESAAALREVIRINPDHYNARYNLGELFRLEGKYDDSAKQFREYLRLAPDFAAEPAQHRASQRLCSEVRRSV